MIKQSVAVLAMLGLAFSNSHLAARADASAPASPSTIALVPFEEPGSKDPFAVAITADMMDDLKTASVSNVKAIDSIDHLDAVASAAALCKRNGVNALLVPDGRYEQTLKVVNLPLWQTLITYPTHVEFRLDEIDCHGAIIWTTQATGDVTHTQLDAATNVGSLVDDAFRQAVTKAITAFAAAPAPVATAPDANAQIAVAPSPAPMLSTATTYVLIPIGQPGLADPRAGDITGSLTKELTQRNIIVKDGTAIDHNSAIANAATICSASGATAILVPHVRVEQALKSHAEFRLAVIGCNGAVIEHAYGDADMEGSLSKNNAGAAIVGVSERAMIPALDSVTAPVVKTP